MDRDPLHPTETIALDPDSCVSRFLCSSLQAIATKFRSDPNALERQYDDFLHAWNELQSNRSREMKRSVRPKKLSVERHSRRRDPKDHSPTHSLVSCSGCDPKSKTMATVARAKKQE